MNDELRPGGAFLYLNSLPADGRQSSLDKLMNGEVLVEKRETKSLGLRSDIPGGMVHHWVGIIFIPGVTLAQLLPMLQDFDRRADLYKPDVIVSHLISHEGDDYKFFLRLYQKRFTTLVFNTEYIAHWGPVVSHQIYSNSISTRIAEVKDSDHPDGGEWPPGQGRGYLRRLNTYWRFEEKDNGVYMQCEALSLTRDIPFGLGWLLKPLVTKIPKESLNRAANLGCSTPIVAGRSEVPDGYAASRPRGGSRKARQSSCLKLTLYGRLRRSSYHAGACPLLGQKP